jgi:hypothetical protein
MATSADINIPEYADAVLHRKPGSHHVQVIRRSDASHAAGLFRYSTKTAIINGEPTQVRFNFNLVEEYFGDSRYEALTRLALLFRAKILGAMPNCPFKFNWPEWDDRPLHVGVVQRDWEVVTEC